MIIVVSMDGFKRNQIDEAVVVFFHAMENEVRRAELERRITRLLQTDRGMHGAPYAFFSNGDLGSGTEARFSAYEAFAIVMSLILLEQGFPQSTVVQILRLGRPQLSRHHKRILSANPAELFEPNEVRARAQPGALFVGNTDPTFMAIVRNSVSADSRNVPDLVVCRGISKLNELIKSSTNAVTFYELVNAAHAFHNHLQQVAPKSRGRRKKSAEPL